MAKLLLLLWGNIKILIVHWAWNINTLVVVCRWKKLTDQEFLRKVRPHRRRCQKRRWQHSSCVATKGCRTLMVVLPFICCDHNCWILVWSLNAFLHAALLASASVVTPALRPSCNEINKGDIYNLYMRLYMRSHVDFNQDNQWGKKDKIKLNSYDEIDFLVECKKIYIFKKSLCSFGSK